jgi:ABC-type antimicrobial peptide transport system permease subunit
LFISGQYGLVKASKTACFPVAWNWSCATEKLTAMFKNYLLIALRNARRNKFYILVNVLGLGLGLACCLSAYVFIAFNIEFDQYFEQTDNIFRVQRTLAGERAADGVAELIPLPLATAAVQHISGVEAATRLYGKRELLRAEDKVFNEYIGFVDPNFFELFGFQTVYGETASFTGTNKIILRDKLASRFFGDENPVGKTLTLRFNNGEEVPLMVGAVVRFPENISFFYDSFVAFPHVLASGDYDADSWSEKIRPSTFLKLSSPELAPEVNKQLAEYVATANASDVTYKYENFSIIPFMDASVNEEDLKSTYTNRRINPIASILFGTMAMLILLLACFNLTNTTIALAARRLREIGIRKVMGGLRYQLILQAMTEILIISGLGLAAGWQITQYLSPAFSDLWDSVYRLEDASLWNTSIALILLLVLVAVLAGLYPAIYSTGFHPAAILKGNLKLKGSNWFTRTLLGLQFTLSIALLVGGIVTVKNADYLQGLDMGYDAQQLLSLSNLEPQEAAILYNEVKQHPKVRGVAAVSGSILWGDGNDVVNVDTSKIDSRIHKIDANYLEVMGMEVLQGRSFNAEQASDYTDAVLINQHFADKMGWTDPIDQRIMYNDTARYVIGVVNNIIGNLYEKEQSPAVFTQVRPDHYSRVVIKAEKEDLTEIHAFMEAKWKEIVPFKPYTANFEADSTMHYPLREMRNMKKVFFFLALLGGILATAGIFSLAQINVARRNKEIGVRKVMGASLGRIIHTLNREFIWILGIAAVAGGGLGYFFNQAFLSGFYAYHVSIGVAPLIISGGIIVGVALLTTSLTIFKAANTNPAHILRDE